MALLVKTFYQMKKQPAPYWADYSLSLMMWKKIRKFLNVVIIPHLPFGRLRIRLYRLVGFHIGKNVFIGMKCYLDDVDPAMTVIEDGVTISYGCYFAVHGPGQKHTPIVLKKGAYVGMRANLISGKSGIVVGEGAVIGAASLVNRSVPDFATAVGVPAKVIKADVRKVRLASQPLKLESAKRSDSARRSVTAMPLESDRPLKKAA